MDATPRKYRVVYTIASTNEDRYRVYVAHENGTTVPGGSYWSTRTACANMSWTNPISERPYFVIYCDYAADGSNCHFRYALTWVDTVSGAASCVGPDGNLYIASQGTPCDTGMPSGNDINNDDDEPFNGINSIDCVNKRYICSETTQCTCKTSTPTPRPTPTPTPKPKKSTATHSQVSVFLILIAFAVTSVLREHL
eukprot:GILK01009743.1.p1 GENE.GILK01009743.1~~GILK01009743.1.p1  ORF type:complete len:196 (+),score=5.28 GILK01009743.1:472-1059(+)